MRIRRVVRSSICIRQNIYQCALGYSSTKMSKLFKWKCGTFAVSISDSNAAAAAVAVASILNFPTFRFPSPLEFDSGSVATALFLGQNADMAMAELMKRQQTDKPLDILRTLVHFWPEWAWECVSACVCVLVEILNNDCGPCVATANAAPTAAA